MEHKTTNTKRIARNTLILYLRSLIVMILWLYTSRVILKALGIEDYGISNVVGGVVGLFSFLRTSMTKSTQRFLNVEMAKDNGNLNDTFCTSLNIHIAIAFIALIVTETIGLYILNKYVQIPPDRELAANIIYQSTILSLLFTIISVPYNAEIIAHEEMGYFAVVSIVDAILKLSLALFISNSNYDRLIIYGVLSAGISLLNLIMYVVYCRINYIESKFRFFFNKKKTKQILGYTTWTVVGQAAILGTNQGNNILLNMFHGVVANAAMGVAQQVNSAITTLTSNFQTAFNPQITKSYAKKDYDYLKKLVFTTSKISFFLLTLVSLPIMFNIESILIIWLSDVPKYSDVFCILILCNSILNGLSAPLNFTVLSTGNIKHYQITTSLVFLSDLIILYPLFYLGFPAVTALIVKIVCMSIILFVRLYYTHKLIESIDLMSYISKVVFPLLSSTFFSVSLGLFLFSYADNLLKSILSTLFLIVFSSLCALFIGLSNYERTILYGFVRKTIQKGK